MLTKTSLRRVLLSCAATGLLTASCAPQTRRFDITGAVIRVTTDEARTIDENAKATGALGDDDHRKCAFWTRVLAGATTDQHGLTEYARIGKDWFCSLPSEAALRRAEAGIQKADASPTSIEAQVAAVTGASEFARLDRKVKDNLTRQALLASVEPAVTRLIESDASCDQKQAAAWLRWEAGQRDQALGMFLDPLRACNGPREVVAVLELSRDRKQCDQGVAIAAESWARAKTQDEQIAVLDGVHACSNAFTMRRNFSFVPRAVVSDYEAVLRQRALDDARRGARDRLAEAAHRCEENCMTLYADTGGVCSSSCRGDSTCFNNCRRLGEACFRGCR